MSSYDPEIDPSIRQEEEELLRLQEEEQAEQARRLEMERTINEILDRREQRAAESVRSRVTNRRERFSSPAQQAEQNVQMDEQSTEEPSEESRRGKAKRLAGEGKGFLARMFSGSFLDTPWMREHYSYLVSGVVLLLIYLMCSFSVQRLHHTRQVLERQLHDTRTDAVNMSRNAKSVSGRSAVTKRVKEMGLNLEESLEPVKVIEE